MLNQLRCAISVQWSQVSAHSMNAPKPTATEGFARIVISPPVLIAVTGFSKLFAPGDVGSDATMRGMPLRIAVVVIAFALSASTVVVIGQGSPWQPPNDAGEGQSPIMPVHQEPHH